MSVQMILLPLFVQVLLTITLGLMMAVRRRKALMSRETRWQDIALREPGWPKDAIAVGNAWLNQFEVPVLFFAVCAMLASLDAVTPPQVALAWLFVGLRCAHSFIQLTYNRVMHRFRVYLASTVCVFAMWALLAVRL